MYREYKYDNSAIKLVVAIFTIATLMWASIDRQSTETFAFLGYSIVPILSTYWVRIAADIKKYDSALVRPLIFIGKRSYFMYLWHPFIIGATGIALTKLSIGKDLYLNALFIFVSALVIVLSQISWKNFELPMIEFGRKLAVRRI